MKHLDSLLEKINQRSGRAGVIGLGYVGLPLAVEIAKAGYETVGIDVSDDKCARINRGENYIRDVSSDELAQLVADRKLRATERFEEVADLDIVIVCVPTPLDKYQQPDVSYMRDSAIEIGKYMKPGTLVVLESTTYPGTTEELLLPLLEKNSGLTCEEDFHLAFSPERVDPGNKNFKTNNTPKVVGGVSPAASRIAEAFYRSVLESEIHVVSSPAVAEMEKILENTYRFINIGLANEMALICHKMDINVWEVIDAAKTKPYGFQAFYPGPGIGGHCIPLDPFYLTWKTREYDHTMQTIEAAGVINSQMPAHVVERASHILNEDKKALNGAKILLLGVAYKKDIDDLRMSPALDVLEKLEAFRADVDYYDACNPTFIAWDGTTRHSLKELTPETIRAYDLILVTTDHTDVDYEMVAREAHRLFDTKNALKHIEDRSNITVL